MGDALRMFGNTMSSVCPAFCDIYKLYSAASAQQTLMINPQIDFASSSSENEESLCQEDIQKLLGLQVNGSCNFGSCLYRMVKRTNDYPGLVF